ncbi:calcineurin-like phosphoesterase [mine drainage metagenome]|uniref:Calcineurin-like phosphoesterase n=1 Tax=mine drainage metagenome TaxID=410659 RepID=A0A1J5RQP3_9ZZZZ
MFSLSGISFCRPLSMIAAAGLLSACAATDRQMPTPIRTAYVVMGESGVSVARLLTTDAQCPAIRFDDREARMDLRGAPGSVPLRPTISAPADSKASDFPIRVCEKSIPPGTWKANIGDIALPLPAAEIKRIVVIGDTGCRLKKSEAAYQACNDAKQYPFAKVAAAAANWKPDLVIHVGDFEYRENECPAGNPECAGSPWGYGWDTWQADFFDPAATLLKAAPWVMVRGNHESCVRAGQGWWRMIDPRPLLPGRDCNDAANDGTGDYSDPYAVPLGDDAQLIVLDTSNTSSGVIPEGDVRQVKYRDMYGKLETLSQRASYNIVANHHPILGFFASQDKQGKVTVWPGNQGVQSVFGAINPLIMPPRINALLSGHVHLWQEVSFSSPHPTQFIAGFSGTMEDVVPLPVELPRGATPASGAVVEHHSSWAGGFGFMTMERTGTNQWEVKVWDTAGHQVNSCSMNGSHSACEQVQVK